MAACLALIGVLASHAKMLAGIPSRTGECASLSAVLAHEVSARYMTVMVMASPVVHIIHYPIHPLD